MSMMMRRGAPGQLQRQELGGHDLAADPRFPEVAGSGAVAVPVIASGGAGTLEHLAAALRAGADAALAASIFHYGTYRIRDAKEHLAAAGIAVRR